MPGWFNSPKSIANLVNLDQGFTFYFCNMLLENCAVSQITKIIIKM